MLTYVLIAAIYAVVLLPLVFILKRTLATLSNHARSSEIHEGVAASCLVAVCAALLLTRGIGVQGGILAWLAFVTICGIVIWLPRPLRPREVLACAIAPCLSLLGTSLAVFLIPYWLYDTFGSAMSSSAPPSKPPGAERVLTFTLLASLLGIPAIGIAVYARDRIVGAAKALYGADPEGLGRLEKVVNTIVRISTAAAAIFVVAR